MDIGGNLLRRSGDHVLISIGTLGMHTYAIVGMRLRIFIDQGST